MSIKLNLGCGNKQLLGYVNIDCRPIGDPNRKFVQMDIRSLAYPDEYADYIIARHVLEHFEFKELSGILREWLRVLKSGGVCDIIVPNLGFILARYVSGRWKIENLAKFVWGGQKENQFDLHKCGFDKRYLEAIMRRVGFEDVCVTTIKILGIDGQLRGRGRKEFVDVNSKNA